MAQRVLSTDEARAAISQMESILSGGLQEQIQQLDQQGQTLSQPEVWDGPLAANFRNDIWPGCRTSLQRTQGALQDLQSRLQRINQQIMEAGGGA